MGRQNNAPDANNQVVSYIEPALETQLELVEVEPYDSWQKDLSLITIRASDGDGNRRRPAIARLRPRRIGYDFLVVLEISAGEPPPMPWGHIMLATRDLELSTLRRHFQSLRATAFEKQSQKEDMEYRLGMISGEIRQLMERRACLSADLARIVQELEEISTQYETLQRHQKEGSEYLSRAQNISNRAVVETLGQYT